MSQSKSRGKEPEKTAGYLLPSYWDERFQKEDQYDWFKDYSIFKHILQPHLKPADKILVLGCGNSTMTADLWRDGYKNIMSIDLSEVWLPLSKNLKTLFQAPMRLQTDLLKQNIRKSSWEYGF